MKNLDFKVPYLPPLYSSPYTDHFNQPHEIIFQDPNPHLPPKLSHHTSQYSDLNSLLIIQIHPNQPDHQLLIQHLHLIHFHHQHSISESTIIEVDLYQKESMAYDHQNLIHLLEFVSLIVLLIHVYELSLEELSKNQTLKSFFFKDHSLANTDYLPMDSYHSKKKIQKFDNF